MVSTAIFSVFYKSSVLAMLSFSTCFVKFSNFQRLFHKLLNQYQACLYLFECIFQGDSKYSHLIPEFWHFLQNRLRHDIANSSHGNTLLIWVIANTKPHKHPIPVLYYGCVLTIDSLWSSKIHRHGIGNITK